jgi:hypothetical protein
MKAIRENIFQVTYTELGRPGAKGSVKVEGLGELTLDDADMRYINESSGAGYEPTFFISRSAPMHGRLIVVGRQEKA